MSRVLVCRLYSFIFFYYTPLFALLTPLILLCLALFKFKNQWLSIIDAFKFRLAMLHGNLGFMFLNSKRLSLAKSTSRFRLINFMEQKHFANFIYKISSSYLALLKTFFECLFAVCSFALCRYILLARYALLPASERFYASLLLKNFHPVTPFAFFAVINTIKSDTSPFAFIKSKMPNLAKCFINLTPQKGVKNV